MGSSSPPPKHACREERISQAPRTQKTCVQEKKKKWGCLQSTNSKQSFTPTMGYLPPRVRGGGGKKRWLGGRALHTELLTVVAFALPNRHLQLLVAALPTSWPPHERPHFVRSPIPVNAIVPPEGPIPCSVQIARHLSARRNFGVELFTNTSIRNLTRG